MKKILIALAATTALAAAAAPAAAQPWRGDHVQSHRGQLTTAYVDSLQWKIGNAVDERRISRQEARELRDLLREVQPLAWRVQTGRASGWERQRLERAVDRIESAVTRYARNDRRDHRDYGYGYGRDSRR
jgi:hypothetical protein